MIRVGIDLRRSQCRVARLDARGAPTLVPDAEDAGLLGTQPTLVLEPDSALVGHLAMDRLADEPELPAVEDIGAALRGESPVHTDAVGRHWSAAGLVALLLRKLARDCAANLNEGIEAVALVTFASYGDRERSVLRDAARLASLPDPLLIDGGVAAALHGAGRGPAETLVVCEISADQIEVTLLRVPTGGPPEVLAVRSADGGSEAVTRALVEQIAGSIARAHGLDPLADRVTARELKRAAHEAQTRLAGGAETVEGALIVRGQVLVYALAAHHLAEATSAPRSDIARCVRECLAEVGLEASALDRVVVSGFPSGAFAACLEDLGVPSARLAIDEDGCEAVFGAALAAARAGSTRTPGSARDGRTEADLGLRVFDAERGRPGLRVVVPCGTALPCARSATVFTTRADQDHLALEVIERRSGSDELRSLTGVRLGPLGRPGKNHPIELTFACGLDGSLRIEARDPRSGQSVEQVVENAAGGPLGAELAQVQRLRINE